MLIGLAIYVGIGAAVTALMWPMNRPTTPREWLMFPAVLMLWPTPDLQGVDRMSTVQIEDAGWQAIVADERLKRARERLSFHELRLIIDHARNNASRGVYGFVNEIIERTPHGEQIKVQYHPNGDWSVALHPLPITGAA